MIPAYRHLEAHHTPGSHTLHPFLDSLSHRATTADSSADHPFPEPDVVAALHDPSTVLPVEGDFTTQYDVIITHFLLDTARNLLNYPSTPSPAFLVRAATG
ncbi:hypothetical protein PG984_008067 [Apiospora sp. TS-2023a]